MSISVCLVDDHPLFRSALARLLDVQTDLDVVGEAGDGNAALRLAAETHPDVMVLDVDLPGPGAVATLEAVIAASPSTRVLMLSMYDHPATIRALLAAGARGYLLKSCTDEELRAAIRQVASDSKHVVLSVSPRMFEVGPPPPEVGLSVRETEILRLAAAALSNRQIGNRLGIRETTVKRHLHNVFVKLDASSRLDAVNKAVALGVLDQREPGGAQAPA